MIFYWSVAKAIGGERLGVENGKYLIAARWGVSETCWVAWE